MKIEKISDTQMRFILRQSDLDERDINLNELSHGSDKTQRLFKEIVRIAQDEGVFPTESTPYLIEASRQGADCLAVMVTKIDSKEMEKRFSLEPTIKDQNRFKQNGFIDQTECETQDSHSVFSFSNLDSVASACDAINPIFTGDSKLYKYENMYFLLLINETQDDRTTADLEIILLEFGQKHVSNSLSKQYLADHAEVLIHTNAVSKLSQYTTCP